MKQLFASYRRVRPALSEAHRQVYVAEYIRNRSGQDGLPAVVRILESWMHRTIAGAPGMKVLEIGAGNLNHLPYEERGLEYHIVEPFHELAANSRYADRVTKCYNDVFDIPETMQFDRILSVAVLEHLTELPWIVAQSCLLLAPRGRFQAAIPSEGGILWGLGWRLTTAISYKIRTGLNYGTVMRHEHVNNAADIVAILRYFFSQVSVKRFPTPLLNLSFYTCAEAAKPNQDRARQFLTSRPYSPSAPPHAV